MNWPTGTLTFTCIRGHTYSFGDVTFQQAQHLLDDRFSDPSHCKEAMYYPNPISMEPTRK